MSVASHGASRSISSRARRILLRLAAFFGAEMTPTASVGGRGQMWWCGEREGALTGGARRACSRPMASASRRSAVREGGSPSAYRREREDMGEERERGTGRGRGRGEEGEER